MVLSFGNSFLFRNDCVGGICSADTGSGAFTRSEFSLCSNMVSWCIRLILLSFSMDQYFIGAKRNGRASPLSFFSYG